MTFRPITPPIHVKQFPVIIFKCTEEYVQNYAGKSLRDSIPEDHEPGPTRYWVCQTDCGINMVIEYAINTNFLLMRSSSSDARHVLRHFPAPTGSEACIERDVNLLEKHSVMRVDNGGRFIVVEKVSQENAECLAHEYEAKGHKQTYWTQSDKY